VPDPPAWESRNQWMAARLLRDFVAVRPKPDGFTGYGMDGGGDIPPPSGLYSYAFLGAHDWPVVAESAVADHGDAAMRWANQQAAADAEATAGQARVLAERCQRTSQQGQPPDCRCDGLPARSSGECGGGSSPTT
jgi:hypothetical protein